MNISLYSLCIHAINLGPSFNWDHINAQTTETSHRMFGKSCKKPMNIITYNNMILIGFLQIGDVRTCTNIMKHNEFDVRLAFHITIMIPKIWCNDSCTVYQQCIQSPSLYSSCFTIDDCQLPAVRYFVLLTVSPNILC